MRNTKTKPIVLGIGTHSVDKYSVRSLDNGLYEITSVEQYYFPAGAVVSHPYGGSKFVPPGYTGYLRLIVWNPSNAMVVTLFNTPSFKPDLKDKDQMLPQQVLPGALLHAPLTLLPAAHMVEGQPDNTWHYSGQYAISLWCEYEQRGEQGDGYLAHVPARLEVPQETICLILQRGPFMDTRYVIVPEQVTAGRTLYRTMQCIGDEPDVEYGVEAIFLCLTSDLVR